MKLQEAALGLDDLTVTSQRSQVVDFSAPYDTSTLQVMIQVSFPRFPNRSFLMMFVFAEKCAMFAHLCMLRCMES